MRRASRRGVHFVFATALALGPGCALAVRADDAVPPKAETAASPASAAADPGPPAPALPHVVGEPVTVEDSVPHVPDSNTIAAKLPLPLRLTPASVSVVTAPLLAEQGARVLGDALRNVAGVNPQTGNGVYDLWLVRGFDSVSSGMILTDGAPEPESTFYQLYNVERAEVLKGPGAFLYGGSPLAATVNLVRKQPLPGSFARAGLAAGSFGLAEGTLDLNRAAGGGRLGFRVNGLWRETDGYRDGRDGRDLAVNPTFVWRPDEATSLHVGYERVETDHRSDAGLPLVAGPSGPEVADVPRRRSYQSPFDASEQGIDRFQVDFERRLGDRVTLRDKAYYRRLDWRSLGTVFGGVFPGPPAGDPVVARSLLLLDDRQEFAGNQLEAVVELGGDRVRHHLLAGFEAARLADRFDFDVALLPLVALEDPVETAAGSPDDLPRLPGQALAADARSVVLAPYAIDQISLGRGGREGGAEVQLLVGARWDAIDFEDARSGTSRDDRQLSPLVGVLWAPRPGLSLYANAGRAFAPPSTFAREQDRLPEKSRQVEVGVKETLWGGRVEATTALFRLERTDIAIPDQNGVTRQTGDQLSRGLEVEVAAAPAPKLRLSFAYAWTDAELTDFTELVVVDPFQGLVAVVDRSGNRPAFAPEHLANLWVSRRLGGGFALAGGARWVGRQFIDEDNAFAIDGTLTLDAAVTWERGRWRADLHLDNLTDEEVLTRGFGDTSVIPAPGFGARGGLEVRF